MNVSFTKKQEEYISAQLASGDYQNASEVVRDALRLHEHYRHKILADLKVAIDKGWNGPDSQHSVMDILANKKHDIS